jgi:type IV pilus assembly protein PilN
MHNIDINFLKERRLDGQTQIGKATTLRRKETPFSERIPVLIGAGVAVALIGAVGGAILLLNNQKTATENNIAQLDAEIQRLQGDSAQLNEIQGEIDGIYQQVGILVTVFDEIKPWSAMLAEIAAVTPPNVQIQSITQSGNRGITVSGFANSYDDVNDFLLTLKNSSFLSEAETRLTSASLTDNPSNVARSRAELATMGGDGAQDVAQSTPVNDLITVSLPQGASFNITSEINDVPSTELVNLLNNRGAIGLVSRINALNRLGALNVSSIVDESDTSQ